MASNIQTQDIWKTFFHGASPLRYHNNERQTKIFRSCFILYRQFCYTRKRDSKVKRVKEEILN